MMKNEAVDENTDMPTYKAGPWPKRGEPAKCNLPYQGNTAGLQQATATPNLITNKHTTSVLVLAYVFRKRKAWRSFGLCLGGG